MMDITLFLRQMCQDILTDADIRAIGKSRGFAAGEIANRVALENFWLSPLGLEQAMVGLSQEALAVLYALKMHNAPVTIAFFERLFEDKTPFDDRYHTFSRMYQKALKEVQTTFVRRGILLMYADDDPEETKMARWRFYFPELFWPALPPLFPNAVADTRPGQTDHNFFQGFATALTKSEKPSGTFWQIDQAGNLLHNGHPFTLDDFEKWQATGLEKLLQWVSNKNDPVENKFTPIRIMQDIFDHLPAGYWLNPTDLDPILAVYLNRTLSGKHFCSSGKQVGYLNQLEIGKTSYYRPADITHIGDPAHYLTPLDKTTVAINLDKLPPVSLVKLNQWMRFARPNKNELTATVSLGKMGTLMLDELQTDPLALWLSNNLPAFKKTISQIKQQWGRQIVHENLLVARVKDLSLRVKLERSFADKDLIRLTDEYLAFPLNLLPQVTKVVTTAGHIVKNYE